MTLKHISPAPKLRVRGALELAALSALVVTVGLAACSTVPTENASLQDAQRLYLKAQNEPTVTQLAVEEMRRAGDALRAAEKAQAAGEPLADVDHLSYVAAQRVRIAQDAATGRQADAVTAGAAAERNRLRLAQRTAEADNATRQLGVAQQRNATTSAALANAQQTNANTSAALANAQQGNADKTEQLNQAGALLNQAAAQSAEDQARLAQRKAQVEDLRAQIRDINGRETERGIVVTLGDLLFSTGQSQLKPEGARGLVKLADFLKRNPTRSAAIEGYTDSVGGEASNQALSDRRARAVMDALVGMGVSGTRLSSQGFGESRPVASNSSADGRRMNRRVEVVFAAQAGDLLVKP